MTEQQKKPRRARGEGGVRWSDSRNAWIAEKTVGYDGRGKRVVRTGSGKTKTAALRALADRVKAYESGLVVGADRYTVGQAVEDWLTYDRAGVAPKTLRKNRDDYTLHIKPYLGGRRLKDLRAEELDKWLVSIAPGLGRSALKQVLAVLRRAVDRAMARGYAERNVVSLVKLPAPGHAGRPSKSFTLEQAKAVLEKTSAHWLHPYIVVSLTAGLRTEEVRALTWDRVHLDVEGEALPHVEVWRSVRFSGDTKTRLSRRSLALPAVAVSAFRAQREWQATKRIQRGERWQETGLVFTTGVGTPLSADNVRRDFRRALSAVPGLVPEDWTPKELRHSFVSVLSASGVPLEEVSRLVGHSGTGTTEKTYRHELRPVIQTAARAMDVVFRPPEDDGEAADTWDMEPLFDLPGQGVARGA